jgi:hypothetical protein
MNIQQAAAAQARKQDFVTQTCLNNIFTALCAHADGEAPLSPDRAQRAITQVISLASQLGMGVVDARSE